MNFTISENHSLKIDPICDLKQALKTSGNAIGSFTHIAIVEQKDKFDSFMFKNPEGSSKSVSNKPLFSITTVRSQKLIVKIDATITGRTPTLGKLLKTVEVTPPPRQWTSPHTKTKRECGGQG